MGNALVKAQTALSLLLLMKEQRIFDMSSSLMKRTLTGAVKSLLVHCTLVEEVDLEATIDGVKV